MLSTLSTIGQELSSILQLDSLLERLLTLSIELVHAHRGVIYLRDESTGTLVAHCARMADGKAIHDTDHFSDSVINKMAHGTTLLVLDVDHDSELSAIRSPTARRVKSVLCVPMKVRDRVAGAIYLDTHDPGQAFGEKERAFVESFASQAAVAIENARLFGQVKAENLRLQQEVEGRFRDLIGTSSAIRRVQKIMAGVLSNHSTILLTGESGTGKGLVARSIHANSVRHSGPFIAVDCGALPDNLLEAELFGHARGAFTGADRDRIGLIEEARGGTLFLDEIGNTSLALQARLLRVLQEKEVRRVGENTSRPVSARFIAATNADLRSMMSQGRFRQDLFYRLNVVLIEVPPLRNRIEDLAPLVDHFLQRHLSSDGVVKRLGPGVMRAFGQYSWPGNVRELEHVLERLVLLSAGEIITVDDLPDEMRPASSDALRNGSHFEGANNPRRHARQPESPKTGEQLLIEDALRRYAGDKAKAARFIGWNRQKLYRRMRLFAIPTEYGRKAA
jgi:Nif-specific regulatory protein